MPELDLRAFITVLTGHYSLDTRTNELYSWRNIQLAKQQKSKGGCKNGPKNTLRRSQKHIFLQQSRGVLISQKGQLIMGNKQSAESTTVIETTDYPIELHVCQGLNSCRGQGAGSTGTGAGDGDCATIAITHGCAGDNKCHYLGACGYKVAGLSEELNWVPGENLCTGIGGCQVPIATKQFFNEGPHQHSKVWDRARELFEARMKTVGKTALPPPPANARRTCLTPTSPHRISEDC